MALNPTNNSVSTLLKELYTQFNNSLGVLEGLSDVLTSSAEVVQVDLKDPNNDSISKLSLPTINAINGRIQELQNNIESISGAADGTADIRLSDGTFRRIYVNTLKAEPSRISSLNIPTTFDIKPNYFFENLLNPLMYVTYDLSEQVSKDVDKVLVRRYIIKDEDVDKLSLFDTNLLSRNDVSIDEFLNVLIEGDIDYILDEDIINLPPREKQFSGGFSVIRIYDESQTITVDNVDEEITVRKYQLDKLTYNNSESQLTDTEELKIGDSLIVNSGNRNTRYRIETIDDSTRTVTLKLLEGLDPINVGANVLEYYNEDDLETNLELPVSINERQGVFIKPIDSISNLASNEFSVGTVFNSDNLIIDSEVGQLTLADYYKTYAVDYGNAIKSIANERLPSIENALTPDPPELLEENFKTIILNQHQIRGEKFEKIKKLQNEKNRLSSDIDELNINISRKRSSISTTNYNSRNARLSDEQELERLENERSQKINTYKSVVEEIAGNSNDSELLADPKYRIVGYWPFPSPKTSDKTPPQEVVQFEIQYRYLSSNGEGNPVEEIQFEDTDGNTLNAARSTWSSIKTPIRERELDPQTGVYIWKKENVEDADSINSNQVEIPIRPNEQVEIRARSISEAGYPINPSMSSFSDPLIISFDEELIIDTPAQDIVEQNREDLTRTQLNNEINSLGLIKHINDSFSANESYYAHTGKNLASGFLSPEQKPISVFDKLAELQSQIQSVLSIVNASANSIAIKLIDENGNVSNINKGQLNEIFVGYYRDLKTSKGEVISKTYFLTIENTSSTDINIVPLEGLQGSFNDSTTAPNYTYPIINASNDLINGEPQRKGQWIYARSNSIIDGDSYITNSSDEIQVRIPNDLSNTPNFFAGYQPGTPNGIFSSTAGILAGLEDESNNFMQLHGEYWNAIGESGTFGPIDINYRPLNSYNTHRKSFTGTNKQQFFSGNSKMSFTDGDTYGIGPNSVGSYLYPLIKNDSELFVGGTESNSIKVLRPGQENALTIPIVFEFRLEDFYGIGTSGSGRVGGSPVLNNYTVKKSIGFDFKPTVGDTVSFDIRFTSIYKPEGATLQNIPSRDFDSALNKAIERNISSQTTNS